MIADRAWIARNPGFNPALTSVPDSTFTFKRAVKPAATSEDFQREIIDFDSEGPEGMAFMAFTTATGLSRFTDIPWPKGLEPKTRAKPGGLLAVRRAGLNRMSRMDRDPAIHRLETKRRPALADVGVDLMTNLPLNGDWETYRYATVDRLRN
jgi:hypothetical protein